MKNRTIWKPAALCALIALFMVFAAASGSSSGTSSTTTTTTTQSAQYEPVEEAEEAEEAEPVMQDAYYVGDTLQVGGLKLVYVASGVYESDNEFLQPESGYHYIYLKFAAENTGSGSEGVSFYDFEAYADGYSVEQFYGNDDELSATLSPGHSTEGCVCFTVPDDAQEIEIEYEINMFTDEKAIFVYEGEADSGYVTETEAVVSDDALSVGESVDAGDLRVTYVACEEYVSDNMFVEPAAGCHYMSLTLEFENIGSDDEYVSSMTDFNCYADGAACEQTFIRDDDLSATLSAGRKASGTVTFEVPDGASVVEVEYTPNMFLSEYIVFTVE